MTEDDAKQKWCPFTRAIAVERKDDGRIQFPAHMPSYNRYAMDGKGGFDRFGHTCIASQCMAWRWDNAVGGSCGLTSPLPLAQ